MMIENLTGFLNAYYLFLIEFEANQATFSKVNLKWEYAKVIKDLIRSIGMDVRRTAHSGIEPKS